MLGLLLIFYFDGDILQFMYTKNEAHNRLQPGPRRVRHHRQLRMRRPKPLRPQQSRNWYRPANHLSRRPLRRRDRRWTSPGFRNLPERQRRHPQPHQNLP